MNRSASVEAFVRRQFGWLGTLRLHRSALGLDILRAPVNVLLSSVLGAFVFQALTPGMISMAPGVAEAVLRATAVADFTLGATLGSLWYGVFPVGPSPIMVAATVAGLVCLGSVVAAFAGVFADPVQVGLGLHRRRLLRLLATVDAELDGAPAHPFLAREHFLARALDLWDGTMSLLRAFRG